MGMEQQIGKEVSMNPAMGDPEVAKQILEKRQREAEEAKKRQEERLAELEAAAGPDGVVREKLN